LPIDFTFYLWAGSLCLSLAAAVLFLWLMKEPSGETDGTGGPPSPDKKP
jgi:hypothetical protein